MAESDFAWLQELRRDETYQRADLVACRVGGEEGGWKLLKNRFGAAGVVSEARFRELCAQTTPDRVLHVTQPAAEAGKDAEAEALARALKPGGKIMRPSDIPRLRGDALPHTHLARYEAANDAGAACVLAVACPYCRRAPMVQCATKREEDAGS